MSRRTHTVSRRRKVVLKAIGNCCKCVHSSVRTHHGLVAPGPYLGLLGKGFKRTLDLSRLWWQCPAPMVRAGKRRRAGGLSKSNGRERRGFLEDVLHFYLMINED